MRSSCRTETARGGREVGILQTPSTTLLYNRALRTGSSFFGNVSINFDCWQLSGHWDQQQQQQQQQLRPFQFVAYSCATFCGCMGAKEAQQDLLSITAAFCPDYDGHPQRNLAQNFCTQSEKFEMPRFLPKSS